MQTRQSRYTPVKRMVSGFGSAFLVMGALFTLPGTADAQTRVIQMPQGMCSVLGEEPVNQRILDQVRARADFAEILQYVEENCGTLGGLLIGPTGTIGTVAPDDGGNDGGNGNVPSAENASTGPTGPSTPTGPGCSGCDDQGDVGTREDDAGF